eukprot:6240273-Pyramimonas_sp.AAC.1
MGGRGRMSDTTSERTEGTERRRTILSEPCRLTSRVLQLRIRLMTLRAGEAMIWRSCCRGGCP